MKRAMLRSLRSVLLLATVFFAVESLAGKKQHRQHDAHVHGAATLNIAFEQLQGKVEFLAAAEGILGFEHQATSEADKSKLAAMVQKFATDIGKMIQFAPDLGCIFSKEKIDLVAKDSASAKTSHADFQAQFSVHCQKQISGSKLTFDFTSIKGIRDLDVTVLVGELQKSVEVKKKPVSIELK